MSGRWPCSFFFVKCCLQDKTFSLFKTSLYIYIKYIWFSLVGFYGISSILGYSILTPLYPWIYQIYMIWFSWGLWHINDCWLYNAKSSLFIPIEYIYMIWFCWVIWHIDDYRLYNVKSSLCWVLWHINDYRLFNVKSSLFIYIKYIWFSLVGFYGITSTLGYSILNPLYT